MTTLFIKIQAPLLRSDVLGIQGQDGLPTFEDTRGRFSNHAIAILKPVRYRNRPEILIASHQVLTQQGNAISIG
jgi:hypothetical protein